MPVPAAHGSTSDPPTLEVIGDSGPLTLPECGGFPVLLVVPKPVGPFVQGPTSLGSSSCTPSNCCTFAHVGDMLSGSDPSKVFGRTQESMVDIVECVAQEDYGEEEYSIWEGLRWGTFDVARVMSRFHEAAYAL